MFRRTEKAQETRGTIEGLKNPRQPCRPTPAHLPSSQFKRLQNKARLILTAYLPVPTHTPNTARPRAHHQPIPTYSVEHRILVPPLAQRTSTAHPALSHLQHGEEPLRTRENSTSLRSIARYRQRAHDPDVGRRGGDDVDGRGRPEVPGAGL